MSALNVPRPQLSLTTLRSASRGWVTVLNAHWTGVGLLALVNLYLLIHMAIAWQTARGQDREAIAKQEITLRAAVIAAKPLEGLDKKLATASEEAARFSNERLPVSYSEIAGELGALARKQNVRLTRVQYAQAPVASEAAGQLTEVRMDASLSGDYRGLVVFLNGLERDRVFFVITGISLTGQQTGAVNLRMRVTTYLRGLSSEEEMERVSVGRKADPDEDSDSPDAPQATGVGAVRPISTGGGTGR